ncbi:hypothetical protein [Streptosporangium sp. V21-05]|uniref:hypothetical protein n=1 Tax=Streptosporangium sp. V21-05 TaxID=3446115 RepID=UPI003F53B86F
MTEGLNGRLKGHDLALGDPKNRLAHGRVAQTILVALLVTVANDHFLDQWRHIHQPPDEPDTSADIFEIPAERLDRSPLTGRNRPPPVPQPALQITVSQHPARNRHRHVRRRELRPPPAP